MLVDALLDAARSVPNAPAVADQHLTFSYKLLARLSSVFRRLVMRETTCERIGLMLPASAVFPAALMGTLWAERIAIPLNFLLRPDELKRIIEDAQIDRIIAVRAFAELAASLPCRTVFVEDLPLKRGMFFASLRRLPPPPPVDADDTAVILYTSGTTAEPKGVELTYGNLHSNCVDCIHSLDIDPRQKFLNVLPPFHVFGLTANVLVPIGLRASVYAIPRFSPIAAVRAIEQQHSTMILAIPSMYAAMLRVKSASRESLQSIRLAISGGEPLPDSVRDAFEERYGVLIRQGYGLTETSPVVSACSVKAYKQGTVGQPIRHVELRIVDPQGRDLSTGQDGEILVRGPNLMKGYYRKAEETRRVIDENGWFHTGDIGHLDADGFLSITGRAKEMLIIGGENVFPREIEAVLEAHEAVLQAAVIGVPSELRGEAPIAFVIPKKDMQTTEEALRAFARQRLAGFKTPRRIIIRDDLPTGPTGKILKRKLHELL
ncbi:MAG: AMP-binding protein [Planctomycetota bacterium]